jgi:flagellar hook-length control protein FliK
MTRTFADFIVASIAALPSLSNTALSAPVLHAQDDDFDSVLANVAPAHEPGPVALRQANTAPVVGTKIAKVVKDSGPTERARAISRSPIAKAAGPQSTKATTPHNPETGAAQPAPKEQQAVQVVAVTAPTVATPPPVVTVVSFGSVARGIGDETEEADSTPIQVSAAPSSHVPAPEKTKTEDALPGPAAGPANGPVQPQNVPAKGTALPAHILDEIVAAAGGKAEQSVTLPSSPGNPASVSSIATLISAARGTVTVLPPAEPEAAVKPTAKSDAKPASAPLSAVAGKSVSTHMAADGQGAPSQQQDAPDADAQNDQPVAQNVRANTPDVQQQQPAASPDKVAHAASISVPATPAPPQTVANAGQIVASGATDTAAAAPAGVPASTAQAPAAEIQPNVGAMAAAIVAKSVAGSKTFDIRLDPPELGRVDVHLAVDNDGKVQALVMADHPHTLDLLQRGSQDLERALKDAGLNLSNNSLNFSLKGEGRQGDGGGASMARTRSLTSAVVARAEAVNASEINLSSASGRLDIRV